MILEHFKSTNGLKNGYANKTLEKVYFSKHRLVVIYHHAPLDGKHLSIQNLKELMSKVESVQYRAAIATTGAWKGTNKVKL